MTEKSHESHVEGQFGPRAAAYVASAVHAAGPDLQHLAELVRGAGGARVLDLGCGGGHVSFAVAPHVAETVAYDLSSDMLAAVTEAARARSLGNIATRQGVAERLPFKSGSFDFVFSRYSAHHWRDWRQALGEVRRVLRPGGRAAFADVASPAEPLLDTHLQAVELLRDPSHVRDYSIAEWQAALAAAGLHPAAPIAYRLRLDFASWIERIGTAPAHVAAIRSLQQGAAAEIVRHYAIEADGSFTLDTMLIEAAPG